MKITPDILPNTLPKLTSPAPSSIVSLSVSAPHYLIPNNYFISSLLLSSLYPLTFNDPIVRGPWDLIRSVHFRSGCVFIRRQGQIGCISQPILTSQLVSFNNTLEGRLQYATLEPQLPQLVAFYNTFQGRLQYSALEPQGPQEHYVMFLGDTVAVF